MLCLTKRYWTLDKWVRLYLHSHPDYFLLCIKWLNDTCRYYSCYFYVWISNQFSTEKYVVFWLEIKHPFFSSIRFITMISCFKRECPSGLFPLSVPNRDGLPLCINHFYITHKNDIFCYAHFNDAIWYLIKYRNSC